MKVVYSNTSHWQLARWITAAMSVTSCVIMVWILVQLFGVGGRDTGADDLLQVCLPVLIVGVVFMEQNYLDVLTVDEEAGLVYVRKSKNCPIRISELATVTYKKNIIGKSQHWFCMITVSHFLICALRRLMQTALCHICRN